MKVLLYETKNSGGCGKIVGSMYVESFEKINPYNLFDKEEKHIRDLLNQANLTTNQFIRYANAKNCYAWKITEPFRFRESINYSGKVPQSWKYIDNCVLLSIHKNWADLILSGKKTVEIRKSFPRREREVDNYE